MKDYTKYDFAAIVGAEVRIKYDNNDNPYNGIVLGLYGEGQLSKPIILLKTSSIWYEKGDVITQLPCNILSLSAKIKVEDMSLKQIKHYAEALKNKNDEKEVYFMINSDVLPNEENKILFFGTDTIGDRYRTEVWLKLSDTINCTDWGWKHE